MTMRYFATAALSALILCSTEVLAVAAPPVHETVVPNFSHVLPNVSGKSLTAVVVEYPPGAKSVSHYHAPSAFIYVYVLAGSIRSQVDDQPVKVYHAGESFYETPGAHHKVSENASETEPARMLAVFVADTGAKLTTFDSK